MHQSSTEGEGKRVTVVEPRPERAALQAFVICDYARCSMPAAIALRFGDGTARTYPKTPIRQSYAFYCEAHAETVKDKFVTCDEQVLRGSRYATDRRAEEGQRPQLP